MKNVSIVFLCSGGGGNLKFIHKYFKDSEELKVKAVFADRDCGAIHYALSENIDNLIFSFKKGEDETKKLVLGIKNLKVDYIITNIHKILTPGFVDSFKGKLINLHYSYLPAYQGLIGMKPVDLALERNNTFIGTTTHYVTHKVDDGRIISQGIYNSLEVDNIYQKTFECGALTLLSTILYLENKRPTNVSIIESCSISPSSTSIDIQKCREIFDELKT